VDDRLAFRTSRLFEADQFVAALEDNGIPHYRRMDSGGVEQAMPVAPADFPGVFWSIYVPQGVLAEASEILSEMPFDPERDRKWEPAEVNHRRELLLALFAFAAVALVYLRFCA
jgi:hypothetical protein